MILNPCSSLSFHWDDIKPLFHHLLSSGQTPFHNVAASNPDEIGGGHTSQAVQQPMNRSTWDGNSWDKSMGI